MTLTKQFGALLRMNLASIPARIGLVCTIIVGVACAVGVLVSMLAMGVGARREALGNVRPDRAVVYSVDAPQPNQSVIPKRLRRRFASCPVSGATPGASRSRSLRLACSCWPAKRTTPARSAFRSSA